MKSLVVVQNKTQFGTPLYALIRVSLPLKVIYTPQFYQE